MTMEISVAKGTVVEKTLQLSADHQLHINVESGAQLHLLMEGSCRQLITDIHVSQGAILDLCDLDTNEAVTSCISVRMPTLKCLYTASVWQLATPEIPHI